jgi:hypothetical protein
MGNYGVSIQYFFSIETACIMANNHNKQKQMQKQDSNSKLEQLIEYLPAGKCDQFTGYIKINSSRAVLVESKNLKKYLKIRNLVCVNLIIVIH